MWVWVLLSAVLVVVLATDRVTVPRLLDTLTVRFAPSFAQRLPAVDDAWLSRYDPALGERLADADAETARGQTVLIYLGACDSCAGDIDLSPDLLSRYENIRFLALVDHGADPDEVRKLVGPDPRVIEDVPPAVPMEQDHTLALALNCYFAPRAYLLDADWRVLAVSSRHESVANFLSAPKEVP